MKFYQKLYVGESVKNPGKVKRKLARGAKTLHVYVIALASGDNLLEIYHCAYLLQKFYKQYPPFIVGIAGSYDEAVLLVQAIVEEVCQNTGGYAVKDYFASDSFGA